MHHVAEYAAFALFGQPGCVCDMQARTLACGDLHCGCHRESPCRFNVCVYARRTAMVGARRRLLPLSYWPRGAPSSLETIDRETDIGILDREHRNVREYLRSVKPGAVAGLRRISDDH